MSQIRSCYKPHTISSSEGELVFSPPLGGGLVGSGASGGEYLVVADLDLQFKGEAHNFPQGNSLLSRAPMNFVFLLATCLRKLSRGKS